MTRKPLTTRNSMRHPNWVKFEDALVELPTDKIDFPTVTSDNKDGKIAWLKSELEVIKSEYTRKYPSDWYGAVYIMSVKVPAVDNPYEEEYTDLAFALKQGESGWVFAHKESIVNNIPN